MNKLNLQIAQDVYCGFIILVLVYRNQKYLISIFFSISAVKFLLTLLFSLLTSPLVKAKTLILYLSFYLLLNGWTILLQNKFLYFFSHIALIPIVITSSNY
jgi:hypothetical protein